MKKILSIVLVLFGNQIVNADLSNLNALKVRSTIEYALPYTKIYVDFHGKNQPVLIKVVSVDDDKNLTVKYGVIPSKDLDVLRFIDYEKIHFSRGESGGFCLKVIFKDDEGKYCSSSYHLNKKLKYFKRIVTRRDEEDSKPIYEIKEIKDEPQQDKPKDKALEPQASQ